MRVRCIQSFTFKEDKKKPIIVLRGSTGTVSNCNIGETSEVIPITWDEVVVMSGPDGFSRTVTEKVPTTSHINYVEIIHETKPEKAKK